MSNYNGKEAKLHNPIQPFAQLREMDLSDFDAVSGADSNRIDHYDYDQASESADGRGNGYYANTRTYPPDSSSMVPNANTYPIVSQSQPKNEERAVSAPAPDNKAATPDNKGRGFRLRFPRRRGAARTPVKQDSRWRLLSGLGVFIVGLAATVFLVQSNLKGSEVVVAAHDLNPGQIITTDDLTTALISADPNYMNTLIAAKNLSSLTMDENGTRRVVSSRGIRSHEPLVKGDLVSPSLLNKTGVPEGMVALPLATTAADASARISSGDTITLLFTPVTANGGIAVGGGSPNNSSGSNNTASSLTTTKVLVENVRVLDVVRSGGGSGGSTTSLGLGDSSNSSSSSSTGSSANSGSGSRTNSGGAISNLTLLVTLDQARTIETAKPGGTITVLLLPAIAPASQTTTINVGASTTNITTTTATVPALTTNVGASTTNAASSPSATPVPGNATNPIPTTNAVTNNISGTTTTNNPTATTTNSNPTSTANPHN